MAYEVKNNTSTLFKNDRKTTDSHPNLKGKALIGGIWYWVSAWTKEPKQGGDKFLSLSFEEMTEEQVAKYGSPTGAAAPPAANARQPAKRPVPAAAPFGEEETPW